MKHKLSNSGPRIGNMYGSPKVHKPSALLHPVLSVINSYNYSLYKHPVKMLSLLNQSQYSVRESFTFVWDRHCVENRNYVMASF